MSERHKVKITVLKRFSPSEVFETLPVKPIKPLKACGIYEDGQEFIVGTDMKMPEGFCTSAWVSLYNRIETLSMGGKMPWYEGDKKTAINCCIDGLRPVVFKLEQL
jgi:uncharacterized repeat protein (TIGR04076 family)